METDVDVQSWDECEERLLGIEDQYRRYGPGVVFRGHADSSWGLDSTLERKSEIKSVARYLKLLRVIAPELSAFTGAQWGLPDWLEVEAALNSREFEKFEGMVKRVHYPFMAYLRQHGFPSPLLDWTSSPYIAAYFAFARPVGERVALFAFAEWPQGHKMWGSDRPSIFGMGPYIQTHKRHFRQQSRYTFCAQSSPDRGWEFKPHMDVVKLRRKDQDVLVKITVPSSERRRVLSRLDKFNLNSYSLFDTEEALLDMLAMRHIDLNAN